MMHNLLRNERKQAPLFYSLQPEGRLAVPAIALTVDFFSNLIEPVWLLITASLTKNPYYTESLIS